MNLSERIGEHKVAKQALRASSSLLEIMEQNSGNSYQVQIGRTPFNASTREHMQDVAARIIEILGETGMGIVQYDEKTSIDSSTVGYASSSFGPILGPASRPTLVFSRLPEN